MLRATTRQDPIAARFLRRLTLCGVMVCLAVALLHAGDAQARRYASLVVDAETGQVLHQENPDRKVYPASLTKIMTLYLLFEALERGKLSPEQRLPVSRRAAGMPPSKLGLQARQSISVQEAILALTTKSANDVAVVVAEALGGTESQFAQQMTEKALELGMSRTTFRNASGLPNRSQVTTARDMARLARRLLDDFPKYYGHFSARHFSYRGRVYRNHNRLLSSFDGADGIKTGYIRASGFNLVASAKRGNRRLIAVVFGGKTARSRDRHIAKLLNQGFDEIMTAGVRKILPPPPPKPVLVAGKDDAAGASSLGMAATVATATSVVMPRSKPVVDAVLPRRRPQVAAVEAQGDADIAEEAETRWGVQVGAYYRYEPAEQAARRVAARLPELLGDTRVWVSHIKGRRGKIYRARLVGLTEHDARAACRKLEGAKVNCLVVQVRKGVPVASLGAVVEIAAAD